MPKRTTKSIEDQIPADVMEAIDEAAADLAADTPLTKAEARERIIARMKAKAESAEEAAEEIEDEEDEKDDKSKKSSKSSKSKKSKKDDEDEDEKDDEEDEEDEDEDDDEDDDEKDEKPPSTHWSSKPLFGKRRKS